MTNILAVIDPQETVHHALERCKQLPPDADLDILAVAFVESASAETFKAAYAEKREWLNELVTPYIADGYKITTEVVPFQKLYEAVIDVATKFNADFVVKPMRKHSLFQSVVRTSTDWNLIRHCNFPMLLVSELDSTAGKPLLAAVDVCSGDENHEKLNEIVLQQAAGLAGVLNMPIELANAWRAATPMMAVGSVDSTPYPTPGDLQKEHKNSALELAKSHGIEAAAVHVEEGAPAYVINHVAESIGAGLIVMGTVARTGISGALIGNTAEGVLEGSQCDVMVVKLES